MRAQQPDREGFVERDGVRIFYEVFGDGAPTLLLLPTWSIVHSRIWKMQVPYLARHYRVVSFDGRGNGRSDRPVGAEHYTATEFAEDAVAVLDATSTDRAVVVSLSMGGTRSLRLAHDHPDRVAGQVLICPTTPFSPFLVERAQYLVRFEEALDTDEGWAKDNAAFWRRDYQGFLQFFFEQAFPEPHSTKPIEDAVGWGLETTAETLIDTRNGGGQDLIADPRELVEEVREPCLVIQGTDDRIVGGGSGAALADALGDAAQLVELEGAGHCPQVRDPVKLNLLIREFVDGLEGQPRRTTTRWRRGRVRPKRALYVSSPIGLGHARRDVAIADALRKRHPDLQIDWLAQHPVTAVLEAKGERVHPASHLLASESGHFESECGDHDLHCFQAWRRMDEILLANFMVFHDVVTDEPYDLWIGDEAWELDHYLHENPELKRSAYAWLTDFVGWLPMADGGEHEALLTADYNAEMIEHIERFPRLRDRSIFIGAPDDIVPDAFGPGLPGIRPWTEAHYDFAGDYITGFDAADLADRPALRASLGYDPDQRVCLVTVGGSGVGVQLLRRMLEAYPAAAEAVPGLRMLAVTGPRIDPGRFAAPAGVEVVGYVPDLYRHLAACDLAVVQGGLTTTMELVATNTPFLYFPLGHHCEQQVHVPHRLDRYGAGRRMDYATSDAEAISAAMVEELGRAVRYRSLDPLAADRVADRLAEML